MLENKGNVPGAPPDPPTSLSDELKVLQQENTKLRGQVLEEQRKHASERARVVTLEEDTKELEREVARVREQKAAAARKSGEDLAELRKQVVSLEARAKSAEAEVDRVAAEKTELEQRLDQTEQQVEMLATVLEEKDVSLRF